MFIMVIAVGKMSGIYIVGAVLGTFGLTYAFDKVVSDKKLFGGRVLMIKLLDETVFMWK